MLCAFYVFNVIKDIKSSSYNEDYLLALFKIVFTKYLIAKFSDNAINVNKYIIKIYEQNKKEIIFKTLKFITQFFDSQVTIVDRKVKTNENIPEFFFNPSLYKKFKALEDLDISVKDIEDIILDDDKKIIEGKNSIESNP